MLALEPSISPPGHQAVVRLDHYMHRLSLTRLCPKGPQDRANRSWQEPGEAAGLHCQVLGGRGKALDTKLNDRMGSAWKPPCEESFALGNPGRL